MRSPNEIGLSAKQPRREAHLTVLRDAESARAELVEEARAGLLSKPKALSPRWLYDARGSLLFEEITRLPEYYPTRRERAILHAHAHDVARIARARTLVELGSGSSYKTRLLLGALRSLGTLERFMPFDVSEPALRDAILSLARDFPALHLHGVVGDFEKHLPAIAGDDRRLVAFLGGTIGNLEPAARRRFLRSVAAQLKPGDTFLLGTDLLKDRRRLHLAYNDSAGVTAAFNLNVLHVLNRELGAQFRPRAFEHVARFDEEHGWIEMFLRAREAHSVHVHALASDVTFDADELLRTEVSCKFSPEQVEDELGRAGFRLLEWWTDDAGDFALSLSTVAAR